MHKYPTRRANACQNGQRGIRMEEKVSIGGNFIQSINFAMQQNFVPVIRDLVISNETEEVLTGLELRIRFEPDFAGEYRYFVREIQPGKSVEISPVRLQMKTDYFFSLTERVAGTILAEVLQGEESLCSLTREIGLLAVDQWSGLLIMPEMIAAFVMPNHPRIAEVLLDASEFLKKWTGSPSFTGYQTNNPNQVKLQMAAVYAALQTRNIIYNNPPASYEALGQRVRLPHAVLELRQGTCLDLTLLYAACLEAAGLYPLLFFIEGHAFGGCWLEKETFADCVMDDASAVEKRIADGAEQMLLVECTDFVAGKEVEFDLALKRGRNHLARLEGFFWAIDVKRARGSGIRPIPLQLNPEAGEGTADGKREKLSVQAPSALDNSLAGRVTEGTGGSPLTKLKLWERKLLDFSLRNALLNFRVTKNAIQLMTADLGELEDQLSAGKTFRILEAPTEWTGTLRDSRIFEMETGKDLADNIAAQELKSGRIRTFLEEAELDKSIKNLYRSAKMSMEENGSNTLFLAFGFLRWYESDLSEKPRYAPLVLYPVDLVRSVRYKGFVLRSRQEEAQINITLLEYLRQDYGLSISGLDPLPEDENGLDLRVIFHTIRQAVMGKKRWNVEEMAFVGLFSFGQFVMWNDLRSRSEEIERNKVVSSLIAGRMSWEQEEGAVAAADLDRVISPADMAVPMSADSSQMAAVTAAATGQSFVLHGPPGTGKSQTITNMIANALYQGKTVLFVAEKMAALNVVQKRLAQIGLDPFCLELHSNKTNKSAVLSHLNRTLEYGRVKSPEEYEETAEKIYGLRRELNAVIEALHVKRKYGASLYEAIGAFEKASGLRGRIRFDKRLLGKADREIIAKWEELIRQYGVAIEDMGEYAGHPLLGYEGTEYSMELRDRLGEELESFCGETDRAVSCREELYRWARGVEDKSRKMTELLAGAAEAAALPGATLTEILDAPDFQGILNRARRLAQAGREYREVKTWIEERFAPAVLDYSARTAQLQWKKAQGTWLLPRLLTQGKLCRELKLYAQAPGTVAKKDMEELYARLCLAQDRKKEILETPAELSRVLQGMYLDLSTDWDALERALSKAEAIHNSCLFLKKEDRTYVLDAVRREDNAESLSEQIKALREYMEKLDRFLEAYGIDPNLGIDPKKRRGDGDWLAEIKLTFEAYRENLGELRNKAAFNRIDAELRKGGLKAVSEAYREGRICAETLSGAYTCNLYYGLTLLTIAQDQRLAEFRGKEYNDMIERYREAIDRYQRLTVQELAARLSAKVPSSGGASAATSEMGILKKAIRNNGRMMSLRRLFDQTPTLLRRLCPCMLMSPISVAQYIDPAFPKFDLVIFDEASQLPTSEAVGTIARGENVVVVGDPKQLPPTNFFSSNRVDEEDSEKEDLESLLDDCLAISMPQESLKWHYRSRHESLIAYSNMKYYDNQLYTFPSPRDQVSEVKLIRPEGFYDKGKTKQNRAEAQAIVAEILRRLRDEELRGDSMGVVTFSSVQQNLIDDMLFEEFRKHPELEELDRSSREPIFVKNLENVQGDERDVILFSVGYGPDAQGNVSMNFGPLNRDGGWRRLNVAISRARKSMVVYSVLRSDQIDLARTRSEGAARLKGFLEFAEKGRNVLAQRADAAGNKEDSLVKQIAGAVRELGYEVECNIGCSRFKMDMGIVNPKDRDTYLLGILLDGENCAEAATARDRFVLQPGVLEGLGWKVMRIWTLDWIDDKDRVLGEIREALERLIAERETGEAAEGAGKGAAERPGERTGKGAAERFGEQAEESFAAAPVEFERLEEAEESAGELYRASKLPAAGNADQFYQPQTRRRIEKAIGIMIEMEAPISRRLLMRKVLELWGISRTGARVERIFDAALQNAGKKTTRDESMEFFWREDQTPSEYAVYRVGEEEEARRSIDDIPSEEILNAACQVLREQAGMTRPDLIKETAKKFGFSRMGNLIESTVGYALDRGIERAALKVLDNGNISLG